jgi:Tfp pilus assembly protein PilV
MSKNSSWNTSDRASLSYITLRCGVLFKQISDFYENRSESQEEYKISSNNSTYFFRVSSDIYKTSCINFDCIKVEKKASQEKVKKWSSIYKEELVNNINAYDEIIHGDIKSDFSSCSIKVKPII